MDDDISYIGTRPVWGGELPFGIAQRDRRQHLYLIGRTGSGKTTVLRNLALQDIAKGRGLAVIDPHGDLARELLDHIPPSRFDDVIYLAPAEEPDHPVGLNLLAQVPPDARPLAASSVVATFRHLWAESWGPRSEYILLNCVAALLDCPPSMGATLLGVPRLLADEAYRARVVRCVHNPKVRSFWEDEFAAWDARFRAEAIAPLQNKAGVLLTNPALRNVLGQVRRRFDPRLAIDRGQILIVNLSKGTLGEGEANLLGSLLVTALELAALGRADMPEAKRRDFHLVIDEFQNFTTTSFASLLSEARKYRLCLTLAHQYLDQLSPEVRQAVFGNCGTMIAFRLGAQDAPLLERELAPFPRHTLVELSRHEVCVKLLSRGDVADPFLGMTLPPLSADGGRRQTVVERSRRRFSRPRAEVEAKVARWLVP